MLIVLRRRFTLMPRFIRPLMFILLSSCFFKFNTENNRTIQESYTTCKSIRERITFIYMHLYDSLLSQLNSIREQVVCGVLFISAAVLLAKESKSDKNNLWLVFVRTRHDLVDIAVFQFAKKSN